MNDTRSCFGTTLPRVMFFEAWGMWPCLCGEGRKSREGIPASSRVERGDGLSRWRSRVEMEARREVFRGVIMEPRCRRGERSWSRAAGGQTYREPLAGSTRRTRSRLGSRRTRTSRPSRGRRQGAQQEITNAFINTINTQ